MTSRVDPCESSRFIHIEYPNLTLKYVLSAFSHRLAVRRIYCTNDELCRPVRIVSICQRSMTLFNALGRKKIHLNIYDILTVDIRPFHAFRTWKVHVVIFSFHATHFDTLFMPLHFRYVNARFDFRCVKLSANHRSVRRVRTLVVFVCWLAPKYILLLLTHFRETHSMAKVTKTSHYKTRKWFFHLDRSFSLLLLKNTFRKHTSFGKSSRLEYFSFLRLCKCNASFFRITYFQKASG